MNKWHIKIYLKSGIIVEGYYLSEHDKSYDIIKELFTGDKNTLNAINKDEHTQLGFLVDSVAAFEINTKGF